MGKLQEMYGINIDENHCPECGEGPIVEGLDGEWYCVSCSAVIYDPAMEDDPEERDYDGEDWRDREEGIKGWNE